jgi:hypothetical protein
MNAWGVAGVGRDARQDLGAVCHQVIVSALEPVANVTGLTTGASGIATSHFIVAERGRSLGAFGGGIGLGFYRRRARHETYDDHE